ncbi:hypothetical protein EJ08DRAFT_653120 [Tothia fuscella]|uniref:Uncharacterized protein n=1 Tax=Tothia fuscella TaxID=1048955 RepID=A0A9P4TTF6_9PEZI|nr:hypothetical protein EJ08DRAFT_653120 [Tothia fuscella]
MAQSNPLKRSASPTASNHATNNGNRKCAMLEPASQPAATQILGTEVSKKDIFPFLDLPGELRNRVYTLSLDWNRIHGPITAVETVHSEENQRSPEADYMQTQSRRRAAHEAAADALFKKLHTPPILLLNKQITAEALHILHQVPLIFTYRSVGDAYFGCYGYNIDTVDIDIYKYLFMNNDTLHQVREMHFIIKGEQPAVLNAGGAATGTPINGLHNMAWAELLLLINNCSPCSSARPTHSGGNLNKVVVEYNETWWIVSAAALQTKDFSSDLKDLAVFCCAETHEFFQWVVGESLA